MNPIFPLIAGAAVIYAYHRTGDRTLNDIYRSPHDPEHDRRGGVLAAGLVVAVALVLVALLAVLAVTYS